MKIVIIEDEKLTANDLAATLLSVEPDCRILTILGTVKEGIGYFAENPQPDLIFSDIQLGDGLSFEIFKAIAVTAPVIFCTAYDEYALQAFKANGIEYLLKPFTSRTIEDALLKYRKLKNSFNSFNLSKYEAVLNTLLGQPSPQASHILIYHKDKIVPIGLEEVALFYIENELTHLFTFDKKMYPTEKSLDDLEQLAGNRFFRVNRQFLVNRAAVIDASRYFSRKLSININVPFKETITISKEKTPLFLNWLAYGK
jgi:DNA-binding LytR/AlgR family response regulator